MGVASGGSFFSRNPQRFGGSGGVGAFGAISSFAFRRRGRPCVRMAGMGFFKADELDFWRDADYGRFFDGFVTSTQTAGMGNLHVRTCSRTSRVTALRMGGNFDALVRENSCCVRLQRVAGACFATFIEQHFPARVPGNPCFVMDSPSRSRIRRKMMHFGPSREGSLPLRIRRSSAHAQVRMLRICARCAAPHMRTCALCA